MQSEYAVTTMNPTKSFCKINALKGIDLQVKRGKIVALLRPNDEIKATTIRILSTLLQQAGVKANVVTGLYREPTINTCNRYYATLLA